MELSVDFEKVFEVLRESRFNHGSDSLYDACFGNWKWELTVEGLTALILRLSLFDILIETGNKLTSGKFDRKDVVLFLLMWGFGVKALSEVVERVEAGLEMLYRKGKLVDLMLCVLCLFEGFIGKFEEKNVEEWTQ